MSEFDGSLPLIPAERLDEIRAHQASAIRPSREVVGLLVLQDGVAVRYERLRNWGKGDYHFGVHGGEMDRKTGDGETRILVHSHPRWREENTVPSKGDLRGANTAWLGVPYGIFHVATDKLYLYRLHHHRRDFDTLPTVIV